MNALSELRGIICSVFQSLKRVGVFILVLRLLLFYLKQMRLHLVELLRVFCLNPSIY